MTNRQWVVVKDGAAEEPPFVQALDNECIEAMQAARDFILARSHTEQPPTDEELKGFLRNVMIAAVGQLYPTLQLTENQETLKLMIGAMANLSVCVAALDDGWFGELSNAMNEILKAKEQAIAQ